MHDIIATNDPVVLSFARAILDEFEIPFLLADQYTSGIEGSIGIFPQRLRVLDEDLARARTALFDAGLGDQLVTLT